jgi:hypothetical protein
MRSRGGQRRDKQLFLIGKLIAIAFNATEHTLLPLEKPGWSSSFLIPVVRSFLF